MGGLCPGKSVPQLFATGSSAGVGNIFARSSCSKPRFRLTSIWSSAKPTTIPTRSSIMKSSRMSWIEVWRKFGARQSFLSQFPADPQRGQPLAKGRRKADGENPELLEKTPKYQLPAKPPTLKLVRSQNCGHHHEKPAPKLMTSFTSDHPEAAHGIERRTKSFLLLFLGVYRTIGTSFFGGSCRFHPSCSAYAVQAVNEHRPWFALKLIAKRLAKCRPGGPWGEDPVPSRLCTEEKSSNES